MIRCSGQWRRGANHEKQKKSCLLLFVEHLFAVSAAAQSQQRRKSRSPAALTLITAAPKRMLFVIKSIWKNNRLLNKSMSFFKKLL
ncbi:hypothetical protein A3B60_01795 [Candidatus Peregrinibacteria bacterium RIFCSPLOWO2_01_FULL_39_12]|nr:MAG: hypothetical protein A3B60_01795 [Candidatus Peregrinibacteria bacterium RIFCSPLOWO2_01_FULL_39_12]